MHGLADLAYLKGDYAAADSWFQKALPIYRAHRNDPDFEPPLLVGMLSDAAFAKRALGQLAGAEALWREALTYGPHLTAKYHSQAISPKTFLAQLAMDRGDVTSADALASEASQESVHSVQNRKTDWWPCPVWPVPNRIYEEVPNFSKHGPKALALSLKATRTLKF